MAVSTSTTTGDLDHPFERILVDTAVAPDPAAASWLNPRLTLGETRRVLTGISGKTGVVYTLDRATGEFLWARPTVTQNVISAIDGAAVENSEVVFSAEGQDVLACPTWIGDKDWESSSGTDGAPLHEEDIRCHCAVEYQRAQKEPKPPPGLGVAAAVLADRSRRAIDRHGHGHRRKQYADRHESDGN